jgi:hypothetical protein
MLIAVLRAFSFLPGQWLLRSESAGGDVPLRLARRCLHRAAAAAGGGAVGAADGDRDPLQDVQGGAGERDRLVLGVSLLPL